MTNEEYNRMINGNTEEFCRFYEKYAPPIYRKILATANNTEEARAILKEVFSDCCLRMRAAGENADPITLLLDAICDRKLDPIRPDSPEEAESTPEESSEDDEEYAKTEKTPEEILMDAEPTPEVPDVPSDEISAASSDPSPTRVFEEPAPATETKQPRKPKKRRTALWVLLSIFLFLIFLVLVWGIIGVLGASEIIPKIDLGYTWFNSHIYPFF